MGSSELHPTSLPPPRHIRAMGIEVYARHYSSYYVIEYLKTHLLKDCQAANATILGEFHVDVALRTKDVVVVTVSVPVGYN
jgi:hypothetical protein